MGAWKITHSDKIPSISNPILIEGLPGIGNVGKIAVDFIVDKLNAQKIYEFSSDSLPNSVFVNEKNLVDLPSIKLYYKKVNNKDLLFLVGDVQPLDERSCYEFTNKVLDIFQKYSGTEIITLGGIGLQTNPSSPKVYCTANNSDIVKKYKNSSQLDNQLYGVVGPIVGVTGLLLGLSSKRDIPAISFLAETFGHPFYLGVKSAREIIKILDKNLSLSIDFKDLDKEIKELEEDMIKKPAESRTLKKLKSRLSERDYIG